MQSIPKIKTSSEQAASHLREAIISGKFKPGKRLRETEISEAMGTSRSPIREAFRILEAEGFVQIAPNKGVTITQITKKDLDEIYELRVLLEVHGLKNAWKHMTQENMEELRTTFEQMKERLKLSDFLGYLRVSTDFHECFLKNCNNDRLLKLFKILWNSTFAINVFAYPNPKHAVETMKEHEKIFIAIKNTKQNEACNHLKAHLRAGLSRAKKVLMEK